MRVQSLSSDSGTNPMPLDETKISLIATNSSSTLDINCSKFASGSSGMLFQYDRMLFQYDRMLFQYDRMLFQYRGMLHQNDGMLLQYF